MNRADIDGWTPLHLSVQKDCLPVSLLLLEAGVDINAVDNNERTPLFLAVANGHLEIVQLLLRNGANPKSLHIIYNGCTALELCRNELIRETIRELLKV